MERAIIYKCWVEGCRSGSGIHEFISTDPEAIEYHLYDCAGHGEVAAELFVKAAQLRFKEEEEGLNEEETRRLSRYEELEQSPDELVRCEECEDFFYLGDLEEGLCAECVKK